MGWLYLGHDRFVRIWAAVSWSGYGCVGMGWLYLGENKCMMIWAGCI
jgi:hypothetical protein